MKYLNLNSNKRWKWRPRNLNHKKELKRELESFKEHNKKNLKKRYVAQAIESPA